MIDNKAIKMHSLSLHFSEWLRHTEKLEYIAKHTKTKAIKPLTFKQAVNTIDCLFNKDSKKIYSDIDLSCKTLNSIFKTVIYTINRKYKDAITIDNNFLFEVINQMFLELRSNKDRLKFLYKTDFEAFMIKYNFSFDYIRIIEYLKTKHYTTDHFFRVLELQGIDKQLYHKLNKIKEPTYKKKVLTFLFGISRRIYNQYKKQIILDKERSPIKAVWNISTDISKILENKIDNNIDNLVNKVDSYVEKIYFSSLIEKDYFIQYIYGRSETTNRKTYEKFILRHKDRFKLLKKDLLLSVLN